MGIRSCQYDEQTKILTATFDNGTKATFDYGAYLTATNPQKNAMVSAARTLIRDNGGFKDTHISLTIVNGRPFLECINGAL